MSGHIAAALAFALVVLFSPASAQSGTANYQQRFPCPFQGQKSDTSPIGNQYFSTTNLFGRGEIDIGRAFPLFQSSCNISYLPLADFLATTGNINTFCNLGAPAQSGQQPPYNFNMKTTSSFQPTSLTPFVPAGSSGSGRKLQQSASSQCPGSSFASVVSQYGAKQSSTFSNLFYSVNKGAAAAAGYTLFGIHDTRPPLDGCRTDVLVIDDWLLFNPMDDTSSVCTNAMINYQISSG